MNDKEALKDIVCALIASGDYTHKDDVKDYDTALKLGWRVTWHGRVLEHAESILAKIKSHGVDDGILDLGDNEVEKITTL